MLLLQIKFIKICYLFKDVKMRIEFDELNFFNEVKVSEKLYKKYFKIYFHLNRLIYNDDYYNAFIYEGLI